MKNLFSKIFNTDNNDEQINEKDITLVCAALLIEIALADKVLEETELETLKDVLIKEFSVSGSDIDEMIASAKDDVADATSLYEFTREINDSFEYENKCKLIESMWRIAYADGNVDKYEEHIIRKVSNLIYVSHSDFINSKLKVDTENENS